MGFTRCSDYTKKRTFEDVMSDEALEKELNRICRCSPKDNNYWYIHEEGSIACRKCGQNVNVRTLD